MSETTEIQTHQQILDAWRAAVLAVTNQLTDRSFSAGFIADLLSGADASLAQEAELRSVQRFLATHFSSAEGEDLDELARDHRGLERFEGILAIGEVTFSRPNDGAGSISIPSGTILSIADGLRFITTGDVLMTGLSITASISATAVGEVGIVSAGTITTIVSTLDDTTITVTNAQATAGGVDRETDAAFRERIRNFFLTLRRGTHDALIFGARQVPGIARVGTEETSVVPDVTVGGIASAVADSEVSGAWIAKGTSKSVKLVIVYTASAMADGETVTLDANLQDATDSGGSGVADFGSAITGEVVGTAPGAGGPHVITGEHEAVFDVQTAEAFLRSQQTLTTSASGTIVWAAALELQGTPSKVRVYIADSTGEANSALITAVETELEEYRAAGVIVEVLAATVVTQAVDLSVTFEAGAATAANQEAIIRAVADEVNRLSIGQTLFRSRIVTAAGSVLGVSNVVVNTPAGDVAPDPNELIRTTVEQVTLS